MYESHNEEKRTKAPPVKPINTESHKVSGWSGNSDDLKNDQNKTETREQVEVIRGQSPVVRRSDTDDRDDILAVDEPPKRTFTAARALYGSKQPASPHRVAALMKQEKSPRLSKAAILRNYHAAVSPRANAQLKRSLDAASVVMEEERASSIGSSTSSLSAEELGKVARRALDMSKDKSEGKSTLEILVQNQSKPKSFISKHLSKSAHLRSIPSTNFLESDPGASNQSNTKAADVKKGTDEVSRDRSDHPIFRHTKKDNESSIPARRSVFANKSTKSAHHSAGARLFADVYKTSDASPPAKAATRESIEEKVTSKEPTPSVQERSKALTTNETPTRSIPMSYQPLNHFPIFAQRDTPSFQQSVGSASRLEQFKKAKKPVERRIHQAAVPAPAPAPVVISTPALIPVNTPSPHLYTNDRDAMESSQSSATASDLPTRSVSSTSRVETSSATADRNSTSDSASVSQGESKKSSKTSSSRSNVEAKSKSSSRSHDRSKESSSLFDIRSRSQAESRSKNSSRIQETSNKKSSSHSRSRAESRSRNSSRTPERSSHTKESTKYTDAARTSSKSSSGPYPNTSASSGNARRHRKVDSDTLSTDSQPNPMQWLANKYGNEKQKTKQRRFTESLPTIQTISKESEDDIFEGLDDDSLISRSNSGKKVSPLGVTSIPSFEPTPVTGASHHIMDSNRSIVSDITSSVASGRRSMFQPVEKKQKKVPTIVEEPEEFEDEDDDFDEGDNSIKTESESIDDSLGYKRDIGASKKSSSGDSVFLNLGCSIVDSISRVCNLDEGKQKYPRCQRSLTHVVVEQQEQCGDAARQTMKQSKEGCTEVVKTTSDRNNYPICVSTDPHHPSDESEGVPDREYRYEAPTSPARSITRKINAQVTPNEPEQPETVVPEQPVESFKKTPASFTSSRLASMERERTEAQMRLMEIANEAIAANGQSKSLASKSATASKGDLSKGDLTKGTAGDGSLTKSENTVPSGYRSEAYSSGSAPTQISAEQTIALAEFSESLRDTGVKVLKLNRRNKWQAKYLIVSKDQLSPDMVCPKSLLWLKKVSGSAKTLNNISGHGGVMFDRIVSVSPVKHCNQSIPSSFRDFREFHGVSVSFYQEGTVRSVLFGLRTAMEAQACCTVLNVIKDVVDRQQLKRHNNS